MSIASLFARITICTTLLAATGSSSEAKPAPPPKQHPIKKPLTEAEARREAARHAAAAFAKRTDLVHPDGTRVLPTFDPKDFRGGVVKGRWKLEILRPGGANIMVSFGKFGEDVKAQASYSAR